MNVFLHETFSCICMCRKPGILPLFDNAVVILFSWFLEGTKRSVYLRESPKMVEEPRIEIVR